MQWLRGWEWSIILAVLLSTGIAVWLAIYPGLPEGVKTPLVADITAIADKATQVAANAGGGLIPYLFLVIQLIRSEVKDVIFARNVEKRAAVVMEREEAVKEQAAVVMEREEAVKEQAAVVMEQAAAVMEREAVAAEREEVVKEQIAAVAAEREQVAAERAAAAAEREQMAAVLKWAEEQGFNLPPGLATNGHNGDA